MAEQSPENKFLRIIGPVISSAAGAAVGWLTGGSGYLAAALTALLALVGGICGLIFSIMYRRYLGVLAAGSGRKGYPSRESYDALRESLAGGNMATRLYASRLTALLDWVERFFGDAGMADRTLFPHAFGLKTPAPLWTAPAFDRCLLLAALYPIISILIIWTVSGHVGPAEAVLGLKPDLASWRRSGAAAFIGLIGLLTWRFLRAGRRSAFAWAAVAFTAIALVGAILRFSFTRVLFPPTTFEAGDGIVMICAFALFMALIVAQINFLRPLSITLVGSGAFVVFFVVGFTFALDFPPWSAVGVIGFAAALGCAWLSITAPRHRRQGLFLLASFPLMIAANAAAVILLSSHASWIAGGPLLLFLGLLTLLNAPFDWISLGLTRALLRRVLELGGWWPYVLALVDALFAAVIIAMLALTMVIGVQVFDGLAVHGGGKPVLPLDPLFDGIAAHPTAPEFWWLYALLLSTMIPSLINLVIGGASFVRGVPGVPSLLLRFMPVGKAVPPFDRAWIALVLTAQYFVGAFLGIAAQALLAVGVIGYLMPLVGLELLDTARDVAAFNLPERIWELFGGGP